MTRSLSNLYKCYNVVSQNERVIDYNEIIKAKLNIIHESAKKNKISADGFVNGLQAEVVDTLLYSNDETVGEEHELQQQYIRQADIETAAAQAEDIISKATIDAESILNDAKLKAEEIQSNAYMEAKENALADAKNEIQQHITKAQQEYEQKKNDLQQEYEDLKAKLEPELVGVITEVIKKVIYNFSEDNEEVILNLVNSVMRRAEASRQFNIRVSPEDYKFLVNNQGKIYCGMSKEVQLEIIEDLSMKKSECIIESDVGVYDCSLDIQLENLTKQIKLLSCV